MKKQETFNSINMMEINSELYFTPKNILREAKTPANGGSVSVSDEYPILQDVMSKYQSLFIAFNLLFGIGTLIIPNAYLQAGTLFSTFFLLVMTLISFTSGEYIVEAIGICNYITTRENEAVDLYFNQFGQSNHQSQVDNNEQTKKGSQKRREIKKKFNMDLKFELGEISGIFWGKQAQVIVSMIVIIFLLGGAIAKTISISRVMKNTFSDVYLLDNFFFWIGLIFLFSSLFSFKNVSSFAWIQEYIAVIRLFAIYCMIGGCAYEVYKTGYKGIVFEPEYPLVNLDNFQSLFSNVILAFSFHHSIPAFVKPITPQRDVKWVIRVTFFFGFFIFLSISYCSVSAFGTNIVDLHDVRFISESFKQNEIFVFYLCALYLFLNVIVFPVFVITCRNNLMKLLVPQKIPLVSSEITPYTFSFTVVILLTIIFISSIAKNIQFVLNFIGGTLGVIIVFIAPPLFVIQGRKILQKQYKTNYKINKHCASFSNIYLPYIILILGIAIFLFNSYHLAK